MWPRSAPARSRTDDGGYRLSGQKMWLTNGGSSTLSPPWSNTDEGADTPHRNLTAFIESPAASAKWRPD